MLILNKIMKSNKTNEGRIKWPILSSKMLKKHIKWEKLI